jgi:LmbE family N-acetylglucosaminyl deacetylase
MNPTLVIAAHPDDEVLGCGGTIRRLANEGQEVHIAILGEGITSRYDNRGEADDSLMEQLHADAHRAATLLGATNLTLHGLPDNRFDTVALLDIVKIIEELIEKIQPHTVYTQHGGDLNIDHVMLYRATLTATRPLAGCPVKRLYAYEVASSSEWAFSKFSPPFRPNVFSEIGATLETKIQAMQCYESEARPFPHPRSPDSLRAIAKRWGSTSGLQAAEAFELVREIAD